MPMGIAIVLYILLFPFGFVVLVLLIVCCPIYSVAFGILLYKEKNMSDGYDNRIDEIGLRPISDHDENSEINYEIQNYDYASPGGDNIYINSMMESARSPRKDI